MRNKFIESLVNFTKKNTNTVLLVGDVGYGVIDNFKKTFPNNLINFGVAEQNMVGAAAGIASERTLTFVYSIANFSTFRCLEQIRNDIDYHKLPVMIISVGSGVGYGNLGYSHHAVQDLGVMRTLPNTTILSPIDDMELDSCMEYFYKNKKPCYLRLSKDSFNIFTRKIIKKEITPTFNYVYGNKLSKNIILTTGSFLQYYGINSLNFDFQKYAIFSCPIWGEKYKYQFSKILKKYSSIHTYEDHYQSGGFGSWVGEIKVRYNLDFQLRSHFLSTKSQDKAASGKKLLRKYFK